MIGSFGKRKFSKNKRNILKTLSKNGALNGALFRALYPHYRGNIQKKQALILG
jgi:ribosomal protein L19E